MVQLLHSVCKEVGLEVVMAALYVLGAMSFLLFVLYDINQIKGNIKGLRLLFPLGLLQLLVVSIVIGARAPVTFEYGNYLSMAFLVLAVAFFVLLIYTLFFAVPFDAAYVQGSRQKLATGGVYGICRHPGVLFLAGTYIFLALALREKALLFAGIEFTVCNIIYVIIQDRWIFPIVFDGYDEYKNSTHFLLPLGRKRSCQEE